MKFLSTFLALLIPLFSISQVTVSFKKAPIELGKDYRSGQMINGDNYTFPLNTFGAQFDSVNKNALITLGEWVNPGVPKKNAFIFLFKLETEEVLWATKHNLKNEENHLYPGFLIQRKDGITAGIDYSSGNTQWEIDNPIHEIDLDLKIGLSLVQEKGYASIKEYIQGIDLSNGQVVWTRDFPYLYNYEKTHAFGENEFMLELSGLHVLNLLSGKGWDYDAVTSHKVSTGSGSYTLKGISSNVIFEENDILFASKTDLAALDYDGNVIWKVALDQDYISESSIILRGEDEVLLLNKGFALKGSEKVKFGIPYLASYNRKTGEKNYSYIITKSREFVNTHQIRDNKLLIFFDDRVTVCDLDKGEKVEEYSYDLNQEGYFQYVLDDRAWIQKDDDTFINLRGLYKGKEFLFSEKSQVVGLNSKMEISGKYTIEELYFNFLEFDDYQFIYGADKVFVVDQEGKALAELHFDDQPHLAGNVLYEVRPRGIAALDLTKLMQKQPNSLVSKPNMYGKPIREWFDTPGLEE